MALFLTFRLVPGVPPTEDRAVGFLEGHGDLDAGSQFDKLAAKKVARRLKHNMGLWIGDGIERSTKYHGFKIDPVKYRECFVVKDLKEGIRLYGYLCNPTNSRFRLCVLTGYALKKKDLTDKAELDRAERWRTSVEARNAVKVLYPDPAESEKGWRN